MEAEPDLRLEGFRLWVHGRERPDANDWADGNWLLVTARMEAAGARVEAKGPFLRAEELAAFAEQLKALDATLAGKAELSCMEPQLHVLLEGTGLGHIAATIELTPDLANQTHRFRLETDQTWLGRMLTSLDAVLESYPVRAAPGQCAPPPFG